jgi:hypothetical protein
MTTNPIPAVAKAIAKNPPRIRKINGKEVPVCSMGTTDVAAIMRAVLKAKYPDRQFKVKTHKYAGGSSVDVYVEGDRNGQTEREIENMVKNYSTSGFDGFIDMQFYQSRWLKMDGTIAGTVSQGTADSGGYHQPRNDAAPADAVLMEIGPDYVFLRVVEKGELAHA